MRARSKRIAIVNAFGALGYMCLLIAWVMVASIIFLMMVDSNLIVTTLPMENQVAAPLPQSMVLSIAEWLLTGLMVILTLAILIFLPYFVGKGGSRLLRKALSIFHITHTRTHILLAKAFASAVPPVCFATLTFFGMQGAAVVPLYVAVFLSSCISLLFFAIQHSLATHFKIPVAKNW